MSETPKTIDEMRQFYVKSISLDDLDGGMRMLAEVIGIEAAMAAQRTIGGIQIYLAVPYRANERFVLNHYRRFSPKELATMTGMTEVTVYDILRKARVVMRAGDRTYVQTDAFLDSPDGPEESTQIEAA